MTFTKDNMPGFSADEQAMMDDALHAIAAEANHRGWSLEGYSISDAIGNNFIDGIKYADLLLNARKSLGLAQY